MRFIDSFGETIEPSPELERLGAAYSAAWSAAYGSAPRGDHPLPAFDVLIVFSEHPASLPS